MNLTNYLTDVFFVGVTVLGVIPLLSLHVKRWHLLLAALLPIASTIIWAQLLSGGPIPQLLPTIVAMFFLPGFLVLELAFPDLAGRVGPLERGPLVFSLSMGVWVVIAAVAYRVQLSSDLVIAGVLLSDILGLLAVFLIQSRFNNSPSEVEEPDPCHNLKRTYVICLILVLLIVSGVVGVTAQFQRYDFDATFHLGGYHKIAESQKIVGGNAYLGPEYSYFIQYCANPWHLVFGLSARSAHINVTWLYACLAAILTPLFFLSFYSLLKGLIRDDWIAVIGTLLVIGPWISEKALGWGPPMGHFYLQVLPYPGALCKLILYPIWLTYCFRYVCSQTSENWVVVAFLGVALMGLYPEFLLLVPYSIGLVFIIALVFPLWRHHWVKSFWLVVIIVVLAGIIAYLLFNPVGKELWKGIGYRDDYDLHMRYLLKNGWIISTNFYAMHPKYLISTAGLKELLGFFLMVLFIGLQPKLLFETKSERWMPAFSLSWTKKYSQWPLAVAVTALCVGPYLVVYNPVVVPILVNLLGTPIPIWYMPLQNEVLILVCQFGVIASFLVMVVRCFNWQQKAKAILLFSILIVGIGFYLGRPAVSSQISKMIYRDSVSILELEANPLYQGLSELEPGVVAIKKEQAGYLVMTTPHYVVSSTHMTKERQVDNERIVNFSVTPNEMKELLNKYDCRYVVVPLVGNIISNGEFSRSTKNWDAVPGRSASANVAGGEHGNGLELTRTGSASQFLYQNFTVDVGKFYEITGYVKSGTSGDEPFAIQIFRKNVSGLGEFSIDGITTDSWVRHSLVFKAKYKDLSLVLRKKTSTPGTMLFDTISLHEVAPSYASADENGALRESSAKGTGQDSQKFIPYGPILRFREHPELFDERLTLAQYAIFQARNTEISDH